MSSKQYETGYNWAVRSLNEGMSEDDVAAMCDSQGIDPTEFDRGARDALRHVGNMREANNLPDLDPETPQFDPAPRMFWWVLFCILIILAAVACVVLL